MLNKDIQDLLTKHRLLDPPADGKWGPQSSDALRAFQFQCGLSPTGQPNDETISLLKSLKPFQFKFSGDLASRIIKYMMMKNFYISRGPRAYNIVYLEGANSDGKPNSDTFNEWNDRRILIEIPELEPKIVGNWLATTEPGKTYTYQPMNPGGAFRISFGQYKAWQFGLHGRTQYPALVQCAQISGHRDKNMDGLRTGDPIVLGSGFGVNQHHGWDMQLIDSASAGCLVGQSIEGHYQFMKSLEGDRRYIVSNGYTFFTTVIAADDLWK